MQNAGNITSRHTAPKQCILHYGEVTQNQPTWLRVIRPTKGREDPIMLKTLIALIAIATLLVPCAGLAATSGPFTTTTPIPSTLTDWTGSLAFQQFNSALGTLTMVQLDLSASLSTVITVTNASPLGSSGTAKTELQVTVQDAGGNLVAPEIDMNSPLYSYSLGPGGSSTSLTLTKNGSSSDQYTAAAVLAEFTGPGAIVLPASTFTQTWLTNTGGNTFASQVTHASLTGTITYFYTPNVPEPSSMVGLACMLLPAAFKLRRRRA
jgi:hypothetical protein